jgi:serine/threonine protein kinase
LNFHKVTFQFPISSLREIKASKELIHENIVLLEDVFEVEDCICLVYEYCPHDLYGINLSEDIRFSEPQIKSFIQQILEGVKEIHSKGYIHRDLKTSNILIQNDGTLKICDFGLSKHKNKEQLTNNVVTRWYKCPELLLGSTKYGPEIDIWSVGCILGEFMQRGALFIGKDDFDQLEKITDVCGTPQDETLWNVKIKEKKPARLKEKFKK